MWFWVIFFSFGVIFSGGIRFHSELLISLKLICILMPVTPVTRGVQSPEYQLVGPGNKLLLATSQLQCNSSGCDRTNTDSPPPPLIERSLERGGATSSVPDITRQAGTLVVGG